jgi:hypothetical protein
MRPFPIGSASTHFLAGALYHNFKWFSELALFTHDVIAAMQQRIPKSFKDVFIRK